MWRQILTYIIRTVPALRGPAGAEDIIMSSDLDLMRTLEVFWEHSPRSSRPRVTFWPQFTVSVGGGGVDLVRDSIFLDLSHISVWRMHGYVIPRVRNTENIIRDLVFSSPTPHNTKRDKAVTTHSERASSSWSWSLPRKPLQEIIISETDHELRKGGGGLPTIFLK